MKNKIIIPFSDFELDITDQTIIMGILNLSPESPVQTGSLSPENALIKAEEMKKYGATIIDVGGNSTSSKAANISTEEEISRVIPIIKTLVDNNFIVSLDSWNYKVAETAAKAGVHLLNDVNGLQDKEMVAVAKKYDLPACIMHMRGNPKQHYQVDQTFKNITAEIQDWFNERIKILENQGINRNKLVLDPGFEFGKSMHDNLILLDELDHFNSFKLPLLVSASNKAFIAESIGLGRTQQGLGLEEATLAVQIISALNGANILRVHDVKKTDYIVKFINTYKKEIKGK